MCSRPPELLQKSWTQVQAPAGFCKQEGTVFPPDGRPCSGQERSEAPVGLQTVSLFTF